MSSNGNSPMLLAYYPHLLGQDLQLPANSLLSQQVFRHISLGLHSLVCEPLQASHLGCSITKTVDITILGYSPQAPKTTKLYWSQEEPRCPLGVTPSSTCLGSSVYKLVKQLFQLLLMTLCLSVSLSQSVSVSVPIFLSLSLIDVQGAEPD